MSPEAMWNTVWVVKVFDKEGNRYYFGKEGSNICNPFGAELMDFARKFGFKDHHEAISNPTSYLLGEEAVTAAIIPLELY